MSHDKCACLLVFRHLTDKVIQYFVLDEVLNDAHIYLIPLIHACKLPYVIVGQARQTRPISGGGGVAEGQPRFDKGGVAIIFLLFTL